MSEYMLQFLNWFAESSLLYIKMQGELKLNLFIKYASLNTFTSVADFFFFTCFPMTEREAALDKA